MVTSQDEQDAVVITEGMPSLPPAQVYQLWVIGPAGARSARLLSRTGQTARCWPRGSHPATGSG
jgi:hypothetical protein